MEGISKVEFYTTPDGAVMIKENQKPVRELKANDRAVIESILMVLRERYPEAFEKLSQTYTMNERNRIFFEYNIVHRFIRCNFGEYDSSNYDIDDAGMFRFEEVKCPLRGECQHEGVICRPKLNTVLSQRETEVFKLIAEGYQASEIAELLYISVCTVNRHRENIKAKIGVKSVAQMIAYWSHHNLDQNL